MEIDWMRNNDPGSNAIVVRTPEQILPYCVIRTEHTGGNKCAGRPMAAKNRTTQGTSRVVRYNSSAAALAAAATLPRGRGGRVLPVVAALAALQPQPPPAAAARPLETMPALTAAGSCQSAHFCQAAAVTHR